MQIVLAFLVLFGVFGFVLAWVANDATRQLVDSNIEASFHTGSELALRELHRLEETARAAAEALAANPVADTDNQAARAERLDALATVLRSVPGVSAVYMGWPDGDFVLLRPVDRHVAELRPPSAAAWLAQWSGEGGARFDFLDAALTVLETRDDVDYAFDPRTRPWFIDAMASAQTVVTDPYTFFTTREPGLSAARRSESGAVAGVDISLWELATRLAIGQQDQSTEAAIVDAHGGVLAHTDTARLRRAIAAQTDPPDPSGVARLPAAEALGSPIMGALVDRLGADDDPFTGTLTVSEREWVATTLPLSVGNTTFLMAAPMDAIGRGPALVRTRLLQSLALAMLLAVPLVWLAGRRLARPVETFVEEVERIAKLDFSTMPRINTGVRELAELDDAIWDMRRSLSSFSSLYQRIASEDDVGRMVAGMLDALLDGCNATRGAAWLAEPGSDRLRLVAVHGEYTGATPPGAAQMVVPDVEGADGSGVTLVTVNGADRRLGPLACEESELRLLLVPLRTGAGRRVGLIAVAAAADGQPDFAPSVLSLARFTARSVALAVERQRLISALSGARRQTDLILAAMADGLCVLDTQGRVQRHNAAAAAILGWGDASVIGAPFRALISTDDTAGVTISPRRDKIQRTLTDGVTRHVASARFRRRNGEPVCVAYSCAALWDDSEHITGAVISFRDVGEQIRMQWALRERVKELRCLYRVLELTLQTDRSVAAICKGIVGLLPSGLQYEGAAVARIVIDGEEFRGDGWQSVDRVLREDVPGESASLGFVEVGYAPTVPGAATDEESFLQEERDMLATIAAHIGRMLQGRRMASRLTQSERLSAVGELTCVIAHDFNNLLTVMQGNAELLEAELPTTSEHRRLAVMVKEAAEAGAELTHRLLAFARRQPLTPSATDLQQLIIGMGELLRRTLGELVDVVIEPSTALWPVMVDRAQFESALLNLGINARDAMPRGGEPRIRMDNVHIDEPLPSATQPIQPGDYVRVVVADNGLGMETATLSRAFEPFFTTKSVGKGNGLGLSMVYGFVTQSRGHVDITSAPNKGTTVTFHLPRAPADVAADSVAGPRGAESGGNETILLVEDDPVVRDTAEALLRSMGYRVISAVNGDDALAQVQSGVAFDLLFTDVVMPGGIDGRVLADKVRQLRPGVPVLLASGYTDTATAEAGAGHHHGPIVAKPYRRAELDARIREALAGS